MHQNMLFCNEFNVYFMRGGMKKVNKNIFLFVVPVARVLANGNRTKI